MLSSEEILQNAARDGSVDIAEWPRVLESLLLRLHEIVHNDFPLPPLPPPTTLLSTTVDPEVVASTPPQLPPSDDYEPSQTLPDADSENEPPPNSQSSSKENDAPGERSGGATGPPPVPGFEVNHAMPQSLPPEDEGLQISSSLPPDLLGLYTSSTRILERDFAASPPYTIQRLAELVLYPRRYYRFLPAYLRALDRIVSISSPLSDFPLPALHAASNGGGFLTNGDTTTGGQTNGTSDRDGLGSDESLGGALLTPIPWLKNDALMGGMGTTNSNDGELRSESTETIDGPHGAGSVETVSVTVNGVPSASSLAHTSPAAASRSDSPTLSDQSDASTSTTSSNSGAAAVTQGELLRQEQEAGVVPVTQPPPRRALLSGGGSLAVGREPLPHPSSSAISTTATTSSTPRILSPTTPSTDVFMDDEPALPRTPADEPPHARGPDVIGMEDMGPQPGPVGPDAAAGGLDMEAAVGRQSTLSPTGPRGDEHASEESMSGRMVLNSRRDVVDDADMVLDSRRDVIPNEDDELERMPEDDGDDDDTQDRDGHRSRDRDRDGDGDSDVYGDVDMIT